MIRTLLEKALEISIAIWIRMYHVNFENLSESISSVYSLSMLVIFLLMAFLSPVFLYRNQATLRRKRFRRKWGSLYEGHKTRDFGPKLY